MLDPDLSESLHSNKSSKSSSSPARSPAEPAKDLEGLVRGLLNPLMARDHAHGCFLNALAFIEHYGAAKIMRQKGARQNVSTQVLRHVFEETRHALILRTQADKLRSPTSTEVDQNLLFRSAKRFSQRLDVLVMRRLQHLGWDHCARDKAYHLVSLLIERRATWFYSIYQEVLEAHAVKFSLSSILKDEAEHRQEMESAVQSHFGAATSEVVKQMSVVEEPLFRQFLGQVQVLLALPLTTLPDETQAASPRRDV